MRVIPALLYSAITRIFLVYSAFETYCYIIGLNPSDESQVKLLQDSHSQEKVIQAIRDLDSENALSQSLSPHLNKSLKQRMYAFQEGQDINVSCFAKCIRHVFAHGILTANATGLSPKRFDQISQVVSEFLLSCMDQDFELRTP